MTQFIGFVMFGSPDMLEFRGVGGREDASDASRYSDENNNDES